MKNYLTLRTGLIITSLSIALTGCQLGSEELVNYKGSDYQLHIEVSDNNSFIRHSKIGFSDIDIVLENIPLKDCLPVLLNKDKSLIKFQDSDKGDLLISAKYEDFQKKLSLKESPIAKFENYELNVKTIKNTFLPKLAKAMNFKIIEKEVGPEKNFQLVVVDSVKQRNHLTNIKMGSGKPKTNNNSSITNLPGTLITKNCTLSQIADELNKSFKKIGYFVGDEKDKNRYTFKIVDIRSDQLKKYLENEIGLSYVPLGTGKTSLKITTIVFND
ncbi:hypothetical protein V7S79_11605 [Aquirufa sp. ROCK-SH2]